MPEVTGKRMMNKQSSEGSETILYDNIIVDSCHYTFVKIPKVDDTENEASSKLCTLHDNEVSV